MFSEGAQFRKESTISGTADNSLLHLGGAALQRCDKRVIFSEQALAAEVQNRRDRFFR
jgi:hypothetical protein